ncbi:FCD domain-containing protein [Streptomyces sp. NPDC002580]|uniref:FCD domain-containing protein n=1 Tax=Streptomyces sp. NPDC002580 TaxID=3364653 RepID=UPI003693941B
MEQAGPRSAHPSAEAWHPETRTGAFRVPPQPGAEDAGRPRKAPQGIPGEGAGPDAEPGAGRSGGPVMASARGEHTHSEVPIPGPHPEGARPAARTDDARAVGRAESVRPAGVENARPAHPENVRPSRPVDTPRPAVRTEVARPVVQRASVRGQILDALRTALVTGELAPGEVYSAPALGDRFGVSATPVREAMQQLALEGAVEVVPNRGFRVIERGTRELAELAEIRGLIEVPVMLRLARTVPAARWAELRPLAEATVRAASSGCRATYAESDRSFHRAVLALAGNAQLVRIADDLHRRAQLPLVGGPVSRGRADLIADAAEHTALLDALIAEDLTVVQSLVREHFTGAS